MKFLSYFLVCVFLAFVFYVLISFVHFVYVRFKAFVIRKKLLKHCDSENKKDD